MENNTRRIKTVAVRSQILKLLEGGAARTRDAQL